MAIVVPDYILTHTSDPPQHPATASQVAMNKLVGVKSGGELKFARI